MLQEKIRELIREQPCTSYHIGKLADIHKSSMSKFMGGKSFNGRNLDKLAIVLGLQLTSTIQNSPSKRGRPKA